MPDRRHSPLRPSWSNAVPPILYTHMSFRKWLEQQVKLEGKKLDPDKSKRLRLVKQNKTDEPPTNQARIYT